MKKELDEKLCADFPLTFRDRHGDMRKTAMCWGFPGDGWEPLIRKGAEKIEPRIQQLIDEGREKDGGRFTSTQIKEKFGTLNWYFTYSDPIINAAIDEAEKASETICEECGKEGKTRDDGWILTLCDRCHDRNTKRKARMYLFFEIKSVLKERVEQTILDDLDVWFKKHQEENRIAEEKEDEDEQND
jgi:adenine-specific DNA methylase